MSAPVDDDNDVRAISAALVVIRQYYGDNITVKSMLRVYRSILAENIPPEIAMLAIVAALHAATPGSSLQLEIEDD